ncbi:MAG: Fe-S-containing hydro-lyase [Candidatus Margulisiibacteriota bacterium]
MKKIGLPAEKGSLTALKAGDRVLLSGILLTARDAAHKILFELLQKGKKLPAELKGQIVYYVGPTPARPGKAIGSAGPTTSARMDRYTPALLSAGLIGMIGKGKRSKEVVDAIIKKKAVYFAAIGGAGAYLSKRIKASKVVAYPELGTEAIRRIKVEDFPVVVAIDSRGKSIPNF